MRTVVVRLRPGQDLRRELLAVADDRGATVGGHLADGCVVRTIAEVVLGADDRLRFDREPDPDTGYDELVVRQVEEPAG
ncbi:MAG TPA: hypothetical protein VF880_12400 [Actinomycetes bacterium]